MVKWNEKLDENCERETRMILRRFAVIKVDPFHDLFDLWTFFGKADSYLCNFFELYSRGRVVAEWL